jgi:hypothetical protein
MLLYRLNRLVTIQIILVSGGGACPQHPCLPNALAPIARLALISGWHPPQGLSSPFGALCSLLVCERLQQLGECGVEFSALLW